MRAQLKEGDIIKAKHTVDLINMTAGDYYKVESLMQDYYEARYFLRKCDEGGVGKIGGTLELAIGSLDFWIEDGSIEIFRSS